MREGLQHSHLAELIKELVGVGVAASSPCIGIAARTQARLASSAENIESEMVERNKRKGCKLKRGVEGRGSE